MISLCGNGPVDTPPNNAMFNLILVTSLTVAICTTYLTWHVKPEKNPRANGIAECMHRVLGDMSRVQLASRFSKVNLAQDVTSAAF